MEADAKAEEPEDKTEEEVEVEATPTPGEPLEEPAKEVEKEPEPLDAPHHWAVEHQEMFRGLDPKAQSFLMDQREGYGRGLYQENPGNRAAQKRRRKVGLPTCLRCRPIRPTTFDSLMQLRVRACAPARTSRESKSCWDWRGTMASTWLRTETASHRARRKTRSASTEKIQAAVNPVMQRVQQLNGSFQQQQGYSQQASQTAAQKNIDEFRDRKGTDGKLVKPLLR